MTSQQEIQLGKKGLNSEFLEDLKFRFSNKKLSSIKVNVLKSARLNGKKDVKMYSKEIIDFLGDRYTSRVLGFSIFLKKWRKIPSR